MNWSNATVISDDDTDWNNGDSYSPIIVTDNNGNIHVVWYDSVAIDSLNMTKIFYRAVDETTLQWIPSLSQSSYNISEQIGIDAVHPAISVEPDLEIVHVVWGSWFKIGFYSLVFDFTSFKLLYPNPVPFKPFEIQN